MSLERHQSAGNHEKKLFRHWLFFVPKVDLFIELNGVFDSFNQTRKSLGLISKTIFSLVTLFLAKDVFIDFEQLFLILLIIEHRKGKKRQLSYEKFEIQETPVGAFIDVVK